MSIKGAIKQQIYHYTAEVYLNPHGQIYPMCVSHVRFSYVNTLKMQQYFANSYLSRIEGKLASRLCKSVLILTAKKVQAMYPVFVDFISRICSTTSTYYYFVNDYQRVPSRFSEPTAVPH